MANPSPATDEFGGIIGTAPPATPATDEFGGIIGAAQLPRSAPRNDTTGTVAKNVRFDPASAAVQAQKTADAEKLLRQGRFDDSFKLLNQNGQTPLDTSGTYFPATARFNQAIEPDPEKKINLIAQQPGVVSTRVSTDGRHIIATIKNPDGSLKDVTVDAVDPYKVDYAKAAPELAKTALIGGAAVATEGLSAPLTALVMGTTGAASEAAPALASRYLAGQNSDVGQLAPSALASGALNAALPLGEAGASKVITLLGRNGTPVQRTIVDAAAPAMARMGARAPLSPLLADAASTIGARGVGQAEQQRIVDAAKAANRAQIDAAGSTPLALPRTQADLSSEIGSALAQKQQAVQAANDAADALDSPFSERSKIAGKEATDKMEAAAKAQADAVSAQQANASALAAEQQRATTESVAQKAQQNITDAATAQIAPLGAPGVTRTDLTAEIRNAAGAAKEAVSKPFNVERAAIFQAAEKANGGNAVTVPTKPLSDAIQQVLDSNLKATKNVSPSLTQLERIQKDLASTPEATPQQMINFRQAVDENVDWDALGKTADSNRVAVRSAATQAIQNGLNAVDESLGKRFAANDAQFSQGIKPFTTPEGRRLLPAGKDKIVTDDTSIIPNLANGEGNLDALRSYGAALGEDSPAYAQLKQGIIQKIIDDSGGLADPKSFYNRITPGQGGLSPEFAKEVFGDTLPQVRANATLLHAANGGEVDAAELAAAQKAAHPDVSSAFEQHQLAQDANESALEQAKKLPSLNDSETVLGKARDAESQARLDAVQSALDEQEMTDKEFAARLKNSASRQVLDPALAGQPNERVIDQLVKGGSAETTKKYLGLLPAASQKDFAQTGLATLLNQVEAVSPTVGNSSNILVDRKKIFDLLGNPGSENEANIAALIGDKGVEHLRDLSAVEAYLQQNAKIAADNAKGTTIGSAYRDLKVSGAAAGLAGAATGYQAAHNLPVAAIGAALGFGAPTAAKSALGNAMRVEWIRNLLAQGGEALAKKPTAISPASRATALALPQAIVSGHNIANPNPGAEDAPALLNSTVSEQQ